MRPQRPFKLLGHSRWGGGTMILTYIATLLTFLVVDAAWLMLYAGGLFMREVGPLLRPRPEWTAAGLFYLIYAAGLVALAVRPAIRDDSLATAALNGAILGLTAYATFELTALSILSGWSRTVAVVDIAWGTLVSGLAAVAGAYVARRFG